MPTLIDEIVEEISDGNCLLFLGAGSSIACESGTGGGLTGAGLSQAMIEELGEDPANFTATLQESSEYFEAYLPQHRRALDEFVYRRLHDLRPTIGHLLLTMFPWKAIITTNYNRAVETGFEVATTRGITSYSCVPLRTDTELSGFTPRSDQIPLFKPHGCLSVRNDPNAPMVLTAKDYYYSTKKRGEMYRRIQQLAGKLSTVFVGYSLVDYNFNNIYYELRDSLGDYLARSYSVIPIPSHKEPYLTRVYQRRDIELLDDKFDTFLCGLVETAGLLKSGAFDLTIEELMRTHVLSRLGSHAKKLPVKILDELIKRGLTIPP
jgi:hypothetical protein